MYRDYKRGCDECGGVFEHSPNCSFYLSIDERQANIKYYNEYLEAKSKAEDFILAKYSDEVQSVCAEYLKAERDKNVQ